MKRELLSLLFFLTFVGMLGYGQDTAKVLTEVPVSFIFNSPISLPPLDLSTQELGKEQITLAQAADIGTLLQKFSGVTLKSYGGIGGLKTVSIRGLGSQHSSIVVDGFSLSNAQSGQINLAQVQTDNVEKLVLSTAGDFDFTLPVSAFCNGNTLSIQTFENTFSNHKFGLRIASRLGSFGLIDQYLSGKFSGKKLYLSIFGKYRQAKGTYPYVLENGKLIYKGERFNNDLQEAYSGVGIGFHLGKQTIARVNYKNFTADQGLPGAVILYNTQTNQRLRTQQQNFNFDLTSIRRSVDYRIFSSASNDYVRYIDPSYLNGLGGIQNTYSNRSLHLGASFQIKKYLRLPIYGGFETRYSDLHFSTANSAVPKRSQSYLLVGGKYLSEHWVAKLQVTAQTILEENDKGERAENRAKVNPFILLENVALGKYQWKINTWYRSSFRMPSFNELYYNGIGNVKLKPEEAHQFSAGISCHPIKGLKSLQIATNVFHNRVDNQILAIPTKNLFVWSMQNIGKVHTTGLEVRTNFERKMKNPWSISLGANYTYQSSLDVSDQKSPTYRHQVAYIPFHTGNVDLAVLYKHTGLQISSTYSSLRYALNENIPANQVDGFALIDLSLFSTFHFRRGQAVRIQFSAKNLLNSSYAYIHYYVMPGRNYLLTLNYAIH